MKPHLLIAALFASLGLLASGAALADATEETLVDKIGDVPVTLPSPAGFVAPEGPASVVQDMLARTLSDNYRLIALRVPQDYVDKLRAHDRTASMSRYCALLTYRKYEAGGMSPQLFEAIKKTLREQSDKVMKQVDTIAASGVERFGKEIAAKTGDTTTSLKIGATTSLGIVDERPGSFVMATIGPVSISSRKLSESGNQVAVVAVALVHGKPVAANFYADYHSNADLEWAEDEARHWVRRLAELNP